MTLKTGPWNIADLKLVPKNGLKVFSCFHCGGGSTMGYKLAGYEVIGGVEIDPQMMKLYRENHSPRYPYLMGVQDFRNLPDKSLPEELFSLDVLDGSPPCSSFSMAGSREDGWSEKKKFREGQAHQVLDDLFFSFIDIAKKLKPKVVVSENVKGLVQGNARGYVKDIFKKFSDAGYDTQLFILNSSKMGVPQLRERTFFISRLKELELPKLELSFSEPEISVLTAFKGIQYVESEKKYLKNKALQNFKITKMGGLYSSCGASTGKMNRRLDYARPAWTQTATPNLFHYSEPRRLTGLECVRVQTFPEDYNFMELDENYVCGMSVPPFMMQRVADQIARQLFNVET